MIEHNRSGAKNSGEPQSLNDIERVFEKGVQVELVEFEDYMSFMIYCEGVAVQGESVVKPHMLLYCVDVHQFSARPSADGLCWHRQPQASMQQPPSLRRRAILLKPMCRLGLARVQKARGGFCLSKE